MMLKRWLFVLILIGSCAASADSSNPAGLKTPTDILPFVNLVNQALQNMQGLCINAPAHPYCGGTGINLISGQSVLQLEKSVLDSVSSIAADVFSFRQRIDPNSPDLMPVLSPAERQMYFDKMSYLNQLSARPDHITRQVISLTVFALTQEWANVYGDPFRNSNLYVDETGRMAPIRANSLREKTRQQFAANLAGLTAVGTLVMSHPRLAQVGDILKNTFYLMVGERMRAPLKILSALAIASIPAAAAGSTYYIDKNNRKYLVNSKDILPTPAHLITFGFTGDLNVISQDILDQWSTKEKSVYHDAIASGAGWGAYMFLDEINAGIAGKVAAYLAEKGLLRTGKVVSKVLTVGVQDMKDVKYVGYLSKLRYLKDLRISPVGLVAGFAAGPAWNFYSFYSDLSRMARNLRIAAENNDEAQVYLITGEIVRHFMTTTEFIDETLATEDTFSKYAQLNWRTATFDDVIGPRDQFTSQMDSLRFPKESGAAALRNGICMIQATLLAAAHDHRYSTAQVDQSIQEIETNAAANYLKILVKNLNDFKKNAKSLYNYLEDIEIPYLQKKKLYAAATMLAQYREKILDLWARTQVTLDKYNRFEILSNPNRDAIENKLRVIVWLEWSHRQYFQNFQSDYRCEDQ